MLGVSMCGGSGLLVGVVCSVSLWLCVFRCCSVWNLDGVIFFIVWNWWLKFDMLLKLVWK